MTDDTKCWRCGSPRRVDYPSKPPGSSSVVVICSKCEHSFRQWRVAGVTVESPVKAKAEARRRKAQATSVTKRKTKGDDAHEKNLERLRKKFGI